MCAPLLCLLLGGCMLTTVHEIVSPSSERISGLDGKYHKGGVLDFTVRQLDGNLYEFFGEPSPFEVIKTNKSFGGTAEAWRTAHSEFLLAIDDLANIADSIQGADKSIVAGLKRLQRQVHANGRSIASEFEKGVEPKSGRDRFRFRVTSLYGSFYLAQITETFEINHFTRLSSGNTFTAAVPGQLFVLQLKDMRLGLIRIDRCTAARGVSTSGFRIDPVAGVTGFESSDRVKKFVSDCLRASGRVSPVADWEWRGR